MLKNYLKIAWKVLGRNKFFTFVSLFGISITLAILMVVTTFYDHIFQPKYPETNRDRCTFVERVTMQTEDRNSMNRAHASFYFLDRYIRKMKTPELVAVASRPFAVNAFVGGKKLSLDRIYTCDNFWKVHDFSFLEGQPYTQQHLEDNQFVTIISRSTRDAYFGADQTALNKWIEVDKTRYQVIGVVENVPIFRMFSYSDIYLPYNTYKGNLREYGFTGGWGAILMAHNRSEVPAMIAEFDEVVAGIDIPKSENYTVLTVHTDSMIGMIARKIFQRQEEGHLQSFYALLFGAMFLFMLLPTLNLVNLNSSRIMDRASEIGVRKAFGATSSVLTIQFIVENIVLSLLGGLIGLGLAWVLLQLIESTGFFEHVELSLNFRVFLIGLGLTILFGFLSGVLPARRMSKMRIVNAIKGDL